MTFSGIDVRATTLLRSNINHQEPDKVPIDLGGTPQTGISAIAYHNLKQHLDIKEGHTRIYDLMQQLAYPEEAILERFNVDTFDIGRSFNTNDEDWRDVEVNGISAQFPAWFKSEFNEDGSLDVLHPDGTKLARMSKAALVISLLLMLLFTLYLLIFPVNLNTDMHFFYPGPSLFHKIEIIHL